MFDRAEYNGVKLLTFPEELDVTAFPYLIWAKGSNNLYTLYAFSEKVYMTEENFLRAGAAGILQRYVIENGSYYKFADLEYSGGENIFNNEFKGIIWSNWDIQYPIGGIYFYASKPIPVTKWVTQRITIDLVQKSNEPKIYATQMDNNSRTWVISLLENGEKFVLPDDCDITLRCFRPDGKTFVNSTLENGENAWKIVDNVISYIPPAEVFERAGVAEVAFTITVVNDYGTYRLNTFVFQVEIDEDPLLKGLGIDEEPEEPDPPDDTSDYITFASAEPFTLATDNATKGWDGTLYTSTDAEAWNEWDGTTTLASAEDNGEQRLYIRGIGNSVISMVNPSAVSWVLDGNNIQCNGNIENLLDYEIVANGEHPPMGENCYYALFSECASLVTAPELPAITLSNGCYTLMFRSCTSLVTPPALPAMVLAEECYHYMFVGCTALKTVPQLPATTLAVECYLAMFEDCTSLVTLPKLPATTLVNACYNAMFRGCTKIKLSETKSATYSTEYRIPADGIGTIAEGTPTYNVVNVMFFNTGGTFGDNSPEINTTYYTSNEVV